MDEKTEQLLAIVKDMEPEVREKVLAFAQECQARSARTRIPACPACGTADLRSLRYFRPVGYERLGLGMDAERGIYAKEEGEDTFALDNAVMCSEAGDLVWGVLMPFLGCRACNHYYTDGHFRPPVWR